MSVINITSVGKHALVFRKGFEIRVGLGGVDNVRHLYIRGAITYGTIDEDLIVNMPDDVVEEYVKEFPHMKYAFEKCGNAPSVGSLAIMGIAARHPQLEGLLNNPHGRSWKDLITIFHESGEYPEDLANDKEKCKQALRNWHNKDVVLNPYLHLSKQHLPQYAWLAEHIPVHNIHAMHVYPACAFMKFSEWDVGLIGRLSEHNNVDTLASIVNWCGYMDNLITAVNEGVMHRNVLEDPYWRRPTVPTFAVKKRRTEEMLQQAYNGTDTEMLKQAFYEEFNKGACKYEKYKLDMRVYEYRFYTTKDREEWENHSRALKQCCYSARYFLNDSVLVFVQKDGAPYGTIDVDYSGRVLQARIDQTDYALSQMPDDVLDIFRKKVLPELINR